MRWRTGVDRSSGIKLNGSWRLAAEWPQTNASLAHGGQVTAAIIRHQAEGRSLAANHRHPRHGNAGVRIGERQLDGHCQGHE